MRQPRALGLGLHGGALHGDLFGQPAACGQAIGHLAEGGLDGFLVLGHGHVAADFAQLQVGAAPAAVEDGQGHRGHEGPGAAAAVEQAVEFGAGRAPAGRERNAREEGGARRADLGPGRAQLVLGGGNVGPRREQFRGQARPQLGQHQGVVKGCGGGQRARVGADQLRQCVQLLRACQLQLGQQGLRLGQQGLDLGQLQA